ncbi:hypothetical protein L6164_014888 [Bauhinia variegata]|uniref:Uncharacterized protein n=1 Tax=Bauhinia variegata TaxID=167791 RepID=A0ACB9NJC2_BAUVA|nr:hypothetical protein L6164_014888 [Bauhinia variegata]
MDAVKQTCKKVWRRCRRSHAVANCGVLSEKKKKSRVAPAGCFCVEVGPDRKRFVMKIKHANHPSFKILLDDAEEEYGFKNDGPIWLPCHVDLFCDALEEMGIKHRRPYHGLCSSGLHLS